MGNFNARIGQNNDDKAVRKYRLGYRDERRERLVESNGAKKTDDCYKHMFHTSCKIFVHMEESRRWLPKLDRFHIDKKML